MISPGSLRGVPLEAEVVWLESKYPDTSWPFVVPLPDAVDPGLITTIAVSAAPSGNAELSLIAMDLDSDGALTVTTAAGQPGRAYTLRFVVTAEIGIFEFIARQTVAPLLPDDQAQPAPNRGFGDPITTEGSAGAARLLLLF